MKLKSHEPFIISDSFQLPEKKAVQVCNPSTSGSSRLEVPYPA